MHSTRKFIKPNSSPATAMTQEKPFIGDIARKSGIAIQSSAPLYVHKDQDQVAPHHHEHDHDHDNIDKVILNRKRNTHFNIYYCTGFFSNSCDF
jgi:hypothetical protein